MRRMRNFSSLSYDERWDTTDFKYEVTTTIADMDDLA
jgi:hypothetical protein